MVKRGIKSFSGKHVLLLQGPLGPFFRRLARDIEEVGARVSKINFNGGDWLFFPSGAVQYRGRMDEWPAFLEKFLAEQEIDVVLMYGDCRPIHACVRKVAEQAGVEIGVFEAGYLRPNYITLEQTGINDYSSIPRTPDFYSTLSKEEPLQPLVVGSVFWYAALWAVLYYVASSLLRPAFPHYRHHRPLAMREALPWLRGLWRKYYFHVKERKVRQQLETTHAGRFFLVPLQVYYDSQMRVHSSFPCVESFIHEVVDNFTKHADPDVVLVIKHHPMDRAYRDYSQLCESLAEGYGLQGRLLYVHDLRLPSVLTHARGVIVVNSTVGLSALLHGSPVKVCGQAMYDVPGLTYSGRLKNFWREAPLHKPDPRILAGFRFYLIEHTQMNGSVYKRLPIMGLRSGVVWNPALSLLTALASESDSTTHIRIHPGSSPRPFGELGLPAVRYEPITQPSSRNRGTVRNL